jgi:hypothetical protein
MTKARLHHHVSKTPVFGTYIINTNLLMRYNSILLMPYFSAIIKYIKIFNFEVCHAYTSTAGENYWFKWSSIFG